MFVGDKLGLAGLMAAGTLAAFSQLYIVYRISRGNKYKYRYEFRTNFKDKYILEMFKNIFLVTLAVVIYHMSLMGRHSNVFMKYFNGLFISAFVTVMYPILSEMNERILVGEDKTYDKFNSVFNQMLVFLLKILLPILIITFILSDLAKSIFLENLVIEPNLLIYYGLGITSLVLMPFLFKTLTSIEEIKEITIITLISFITGRMFTMVDNPMIKDIGGEIGIAIGIVVDLYIINKETNFILDTNLWKNIKKLSGAALTMLGVLLIMKLGYEYFLKEIIKSKLIVFISISASGIFIYINLLYGNLRNKLSE